MPQWQPISWPLTGGLDTKKSPLQVGASKSPLQAAPGSNIVLSNVRQERDGEWKPRPGWTHNAADDLPSMPMKEVGLPGGGRVALTHETGVLGSALLYQSGAAAGRWVRSQAELSSQTSPSVWNRRSLAAADTMVVSDHCEGSVYALTAWAGGNGSSGGVFKITNKADGTALPDPVNGAGLLPSGSVRPRCVAGPGDTLCLLWVDTASQSLRMTVWSGSTGAFIVTGFPTGLAADINPIHFMDAFYYGGTTLTIVVRTNVPAVSFLETIPSTIVSTTNVGLGVDANLALSLLPDPDASGTRFVAFSNTTPTTRVLRVSSAGATLTTDPIGAIQVDQITGVAYQAGASWMAVYHLAGGGISASKKFSGVVGAATVLVAPPSLAATAALYGLNSAAWRDPTQDVMRFLAGVHAPAVTDAQDTYLELALPYNVGGTTVMNNFPEPQARLLPLQAGPSASAVFPGSLPHVQRTGAEQFVTALVRLGRVSTQASTTANQYAVDRWQVTTISAANLATANQGRGCTGNAASYIPVGSLLQTAGAAPVSHGICAVPLKPRATPGVAGGLTAGQAYQHLVVVEVPNENGDVWRSPQSTPSNVTAAAMAGNTQITLDVVVSATELPARVCTVKIYRTFGNGSVFRLVNSRTAQIGTLGAFTFVDQVSDATLASGDPYFGEVPATITPAFSHTEVFGNRLWGVERDFPNLWCSKPLQKGLQPEFPGVTPWVLPLADQFGDPTGLVALDDKLILLKRNAVYAIQGDGPDNAGGGQPFSVTRAESDVGSLPGSPTVSTGAEAFFVSERGIHMVDRSMQVTFVGAAVDRYFTQPSLGTVPQTVTGAVFSSARNEVRFTCNNAGGATPGLALVYDRLRGIWFIDAGVGLNNAQVSRLFGATEVRYTTSGAMFVEGPNDGTVTDDAGTAFASTMGSAWIQAAGPQGRFRLRRARCLGQPVAAAGSITPVLQIFWNFDETGSLFPPAESASPVASISNGAGTVRAELAPRNQKCSAFRLQLTLPSGNTTYRLEQWAAVVGIKPGAQKLNTSERWT